MPFKETCQASTRSILSDINPVCTDAIPPRAEMI